MPTPEDEARDERAEVLAGKVKDEADAVTERVEQRAEALEEQRAGQAAALEVQRAGQAEALAKLQAAQRVGQRAEERVDQRADLQSALAGITEAIGTLIQHMDQSLPEERVQALLDAAVADQQQGRRRLLISILSPILIVLAVVLAQVVQTEQIKNTAKDSSATADYVRGCIQHPDRLTSDQRRELCGTPQTGFFIHYLNCVFLTLPEDRTEAVLTQCATDAQRKTVR